MQVGEKLDQMYLTVGLVEGNNLVFFHVITIFIIYVLERQMKIYGKLGGGSELCEHKILFSPYTKPYWIGSSVANSDANVPKSRSQMIRTPP